jgi:pantetheine-phosphate adenylyltransferase
MAKEDRVAIYAGTFDPITLGHLWIIKAGAKMFDKLVVAVGTNPEKTCYFSLDDRIQMIKESINGFKNVVVDNYTDKFLIKHAESIGAKYILRGIRSTADYEYEKSLSYVNRHLNDDIITVFILPPRELIEISSSIVRGLIGPEGWEGIVKNYVHTCVLAKLIEEHKRRSQGGN